MLRRLVPALLVSLLLSTGLAGPPAGVAAPAAPRPGCDQVELVWLPGSAARDDGLRGVRRALRFVVGRGETGVTRVGRVGPRLTAARLAQVRRRGLAASHLAGWRADARAAVVALGRVHRACPDALLALGGFSRGAVATRAAVRSLTRVPALRRRLGLVVTVGDPLLRPGDRVVGEVADLGSPPRGAAGRALPWPRWARAAALSWCDDDRMCTPQGSVAGHDYTGGQLPVGDELAAMPVDAADARSTLVGEPFGYRAGSLRIVGADRLPAGLELHGGAVSGSPLATGTRRVRLRVRSTTVAPDVRRTRVLELAVVAPRAAAGTTLVTRGWDGAPADGPSSGVLVSGDGGTLVFASAATNLVPGSTRACRTFVWSRATGRTETLAADPSGVCGVALDISRDGTRVLSYVEGRVPGAGGRLELVDRAAGTRTTVATGVPGETTLMPDDGESVIYRADRFGAFRRWDRASGTTTPLPAPPSPGGPEQLVDWTGGGSADGRHLLLQNPAGLWDTTTGTFTALHDTGTWAGWQAYAVAEVSLDATLGVVRGLGPAAGSGEGGSPAGLLLSWPSGDVVGPAGGSNLGAAITPDGGWLAIAGRYGRDRLSLAQVATGARAFAFAAPAPGTDGGVMSAAALGDDGRTLAYVSSASDLLPGAGRGTANVYFWSR